MTLRIFSIQIFLAKIFADPKALRSDADHGRTVHWVSLRSLRHFSANSAVKVFDRIPAETR